MPRFHFIENKPPVPNYSKLTKAEKGSAKVKNNRVFQAGIPWPAADKPAKAETTELILSIPLPGPQFRF
jgi:hypothetical protein